MLPNILSLGQRVATPDCVTQHIANVIYSTLLDPLYSARVPELEFEVRLGTIMNSTDQRFPDRSRGMGGVYIQSKTPHTHFESGIKEPLFNRLLSALQVAHTSEPRCAVPLALRLMPGLLDVRQSDSTDFYCHYGQQHLRFSCLTDDLVGRSPVGAVSPPRVIEKISRETWELAWLGAPYDARFQLSLEQPQPERVAEDYRPDTSSDLVRRKQRWSFVYPAVQIDLTRVTDRRGRRDDTTVTYEAEVEIRAERVAELAAAVARMSEYALAPSVLAAETALHRARDGEAQRAATIELARAVAADPSGAQQVADTALLYDTADAVHGAIRALLSAVGDNPLFALN